MKVNTKQKHFHTGLVLAIFLLLLNPLPASSFSEKGGSTNTAEGDKAGVTMQTVSGQVVGTIDSGGYTYAQVFAIAGMTAEVIETLEPILHSPSATSVFLVDLDPSFDAIRDDPEFKAMMERNR